MIHLVLDLLVNIDVISKIVPNSIFIYDIDPESVAKQLKANILNLQCSVKQICSDEFKTIDEFLIHIASKIE